MNSSEYPPGVIEHLPDGKLEIISCKEQIDSIIEMNKNIVKQNEKLLEVLLLTQVLLEDK